ncbi:hypothetical protein BH10PSE1_BH10PSE1_33640 [soil metagenome]
MLEMIGLMVAAQSFWTPNAQTGVPVTECVMGERVLTVVDEGLFPSTIVGTAGAGECLSRIDDWASSDPLPIVFGDLLRGTNPPAPSEAALRFAAMPSFANADAIRFRSLAAETHADARAYFSRFTISSRDDLIVTRICNPDWQSPVCKRANAQFHGSYNAAMEAVDQRNARAEAEDRATRAASEPVNSGYYQSGQYSRDVAASRGVASSSSSTATSGSAPVQVQSESEIRRQQERCRTGSGPC